ncbi:uncharacterized protein LOC103465269 [Poecilia reticulata]|uniref:uncharacterized protein LOC103465269 n=1 Tax=Poecilia reticulata TaxID=8081 RepID=UPI0004A3064C|nr:PREDICTED: uncharacterized protein LOC103465269 [Poecilia reticulata]
MAEAGPASWGQITAQRRTATQKVPVVRVCLSSPFPSFLVCFPLVSFISTCPWNHHFSRHPADVTHAPPLRSVLVQPGHTPAAGLEGVDLRYKQQLHSVSPPECLPTTILPPSSSCFPETSCPRIRVSLSPRCGSPPSCVISRRCRCSRSDATPCVCVRDLPSSIPPRDFPFGTLRARRPTPELPGGPPGRIRLQAVPDIRAKHRSSTDTRLALRFAPNTSTPIEEPVRRFGFATSSLILQ